MESDGGAAARSRQRAGGEETYESHAVKLPAGQMILLPQRVCIAYSRFDQAFITTC
jgi:hypothetical protein